MFTVGLAQNNSVVRDGAINPISIRLLICVLITRICVPSIVSL